MSARGMRKQILFDDLVWADTQFPLREVVTKLREHAPFLFQVTEGYLGRDSDIHTISSEEVYWFADLVTKPRLVVQDYLNRHYSIPTDCKEEVIPVTNGGKVGPHMMLQEMYQDCRYTAFHFASDSSQSVYSGADSSKAYDFGKLTITDDYHEKFIAAYLLKPKCVAGLQKYHEEVTIGTLAKQLYLIPVYMPIDVTVAMSIAKRSERTFFKTMLGFHRQAISFDLPGQLSAALKRPALCKIMAFQETPCNDYDYIELVSIDVKNQASANNDNPLRINFSKQLMDDELDDYEVIDDQAMKKIAVRTRVLKFLVRMSNIFRTDTLPDGNSSEEEDQPSLPARKMSTGSVSGRSLHPSHSLLDQDLPPLPPKRPIKPNLKSCQTSTYAQTQLPSDRKELKLGNERPVPDAGLDFKPSDIHSSDFASDLAEQKKRLRKVKSQPRTVADSFVVGNVLHQDGKSTSDVGQTTGSTDIRPVPANPMMTFESAADSVSFNTAFENTPTVEDTSLKQVSKHKTPRHPASTDSHGSVKSKDALPTVSKKVRPLVPQKPSSKTNKLQGTSSSELHTPKPTIQSTIRKINMNEKGKFNAASENTTKQVRPVLEIENIAAVPSDVSNFSVRDVCHCLKLLHMSEYAQTFSEMQIDGKMLLSLDADILQEDLECKAVHAMKLVKFATQGWRPKEH